MYIPYPLDLQIFLMLNGSQGPFMDMLMCLISYEYTWVPLYLGVLCYIIWKRGWRTGLAVLLLCAIAVGLSDQTATQMKHLFPKLRPTHYPVLEGMVHTVNGYVGGLYCTVSSHAANSLAFAVISAYFIRNRWYSIAIVLWLLVVSYSRIYLGVHYPSDILLGYVDGMAYSVILLILYNKWFAKYTENEKLD